MRKSTILSLMFSSMGICSLYAGGIVTNTNHHTAFDRMMSRDAAIGIDGVHSNPAGVVFMKEGHHLSITNQTVIQTRTITNDFIPFQYNMNNPNTSHEFKGETFCPIVPSAQYAYNKGKLSLQAEFCFVGGGGKCEFKDGLGSLEQVVAGLAAKQSATGYSYNAYLKGKQFYYGLSVGAAYKILPNLSAFIGVRGIYASCNYNGYVKDITLKLKGQNMPLPTNLSMDIDQTGFGVTPIIGIDFKWNRLNFAVKYEFKTRLRLENKWNSEKTPDISTIPALKEYTEDKIPADIPALLTAGVSYNVINPLHINAGFHYFYDRQATTYGNKNELLDRGTIEWNLGAEYDVSKMVTISAGWQNTNYGLPEDPEKLAQYMSDKCFVTSSNSIGAGTSLHLSEKVDLNFSYFCTLYQHVKTTQKVSGLDYKSDFHRTNHVIGVGVDLHL